MAKVRSTDRSDLFEALLNGKEQECARLLSRMVFKTISFHDYKEDFYHAFVTGILSFSGYKVVSNKELMTTYSFMELVFLRSGVK